MAQPVPQRDREWAEFIFCGKYDGALFDLLGAACGPGSAARNLLDALKTLESALAAGLPAGPDADQRDELFRAVALAHASAIHFLPAECSRALIAAGMEAAAALVILWAETDDEREARDPDVLTEALAQLRIFINALRGVTAAEEGATRAKGRHAAARV